MSRSLGAGNLAQALVFGGLSWWLWPQWGPAAALLGVLAAAQLGAGLALFAGRAGPARLACALSLLGVLLLIAFYGQAVYALSVRFGDEARSAAWRTLGGVALALPWLIGWPLVQLGLSRPNRGRPLAGLALIGGAVGGLGSLGWHQPVQTWASQPALSAAAQGAFARWTGADPAAPLGDGPAATVLVTPWIDGQPGDAVRGDGDQLADALAAALGALPPPRGARSALVVDVARARFREHAPMPPGTGGGLLAKGGLSPVTAAQPGRIGRATLLPELTVPAPKLSGAAPVIFDSVLVDGDGARRLLNGWTTPPAVSADAAREAALAAGRMIVEGQAEDGRFTYVVKGPEGRAGGGYNYPRHAGVTWFLARLAERTGDPGIAAGAERGLDFMERATGTRSDGAAYVRDPERDDGLVWVGTTALAALAAASRGHASAGPWSRFLADSVDSDGLVRGEMVVETEVFKRDLANPYGQGQTMLALASLSRAGLPEVQSALARAAAFVDGPYAPGAAGRLVTVDEHWACLAALATKEVTGVAAGWEICRAYVVSQAFQVPSRGSQIHLSAGAAGGLAEAVVAAAVLDPSGPYRDQALDFADLFLREAYRPGDAPLLERPRLLLGGFRDGPGRWDVRMDAVQHIGCALLGVEALLDRDWPGSLP